MADLPAPPRTVSRIEDLPDGFADLLARPPVLIGDVIADRYRLVEVLGDGAMGQVFIAENLTIGQRVAIKVLRPELLAQAAFRQRFQHEAEAIASIEHRNVARFFDVVVGDPTFLVMEHVRGPTLAARLKEERRMSIEDAVNIGVRLCWALEAAHQAGVVHRDLKPANIILCPDVENGVEPKLIDFGLAKLAAAATRSQVTRTGQIIGTPEYMSPEQIANQEVDGRSDIYSLGCLLYEMLSGQTPFAGSDDVQLLYQQVTSPAPPLDRYLPDAPPELCKVIAKALAKEPGKRFQSMPELALALREASLGLQSAKSYRSSPRALIFAFLCLLALLCFLAKSALHQKPPIGATLLLVTRPADAQVEVDGRALADHTPAALTGLAAGSHAVRFRKDGMGMVDRQITIGAGERQLVDVPLPALKRTIALNTTPEGAAVFVDGRLAVGLTPIALDLELEDFHELRFEKDGFEAATRSLLPESHETALAVQLEPERFARATLYVDANSAADVWIDGVDTGFTTPTLGLRLAPGVHHVEAHEGKRSAASDVKLAPGQTARLLLTPKEAETTDSPAADRHE